MNPQHAHELLATYASDTLLHNQQVGWLMRWFAQSLGEDIDRWYITWLLHDIDRDHIGKDADKHLWDEFAQIMDQLTIAMSPSLWKEVAAKLTEDLVADIRTHYPSKTQLEPSTLIQKYLISIDELSGLMYAYSRMRWGFDGMEVKWVIKKIKDKSFAAGVDREHVRNCEIYLNIPLEEFVWQMIQAFQSL